MLQLGYKNFVFDYEPYPIGVSRGFVEPELYKKLVENFPPIELFGTFPDGKSHKKALAELYRPEAYHKFLRETPVYLEFYKYIKSPQFIHDVLNCFDQNQIHLGLEKAKIISSTAPLHGSIFHKLEKIKRRLRLQKGLRARFEFSALPSDGGSIRPHTDAPSKIITLILSILKEGEWNPAWKGGTEILRPKDIRKNYNFSNSYLDFDECETLRTIEYVPNQCILFLKTFNSLHSVAPIQNKGGTAYRRTLTLNIESI